jgi:hypothetical protein
MAARPPILELDPFNLPEDVRAEVPLPSVGIDPWTKPLTPKAAYLIGRIDGMTTLGDLTTGVALPPRDVIESLVLLHEHGLVSFEPPFEARWLRASPRSAAPAPPAVPVPAASLQPPSPRITTAPASAASASPGDPSVRFTMYPAAEPKPDAAPAMPLAIDRQGGLDARPLARLARDLGTARWTGVLTLRRENVEKRIEFVAGDPVQVHSSSPDEEIGILMSTRGKISSRALERYRHVRSGGVEPLAALVEIGAVSQFDLPRADRWRAQAVLFDALLWRNGTYRLGKDGELPAGGLRHDLPFETLILKAWREAPFEDSRRKFFDEHRNWYVVLEAIDDAAIERMRLKPKEERLLLSIREQTRRIRDVFEITPLLHGETYRFLDGLFAMGLTALSEQNPTESGPVDPRELPDQLQSFKAMNHFDRLSAHPISTDEDIETAYRRKMEMYGPDRYHNLKPATRKTLETIVQLLAESYAVLRDPNRRKAYRMQEYDKIRLEYFAELQFRKGEIFLFWREDSRTAYEIFDSVHEMAPDNPLYGASFALTLARAFPGDRERHAQAVKVLEAALARGGVNPKVLAIGAAAARALGDVARSDQLCVQALRLSGNAPEIVQMVNKMRARPE